MLTKDFLPALSDYAAQEADKAMAVKNFIPEASTAEAAALVGKLTSAYESISSGVKALDKEIQTVSGFCFHAEGRGLLPQHAPGVHGQTPSNRRRRGSQNPG